MSSGLIGVTGATGAIGGQVAAALAATRTPQRLIVRDAARAPSLAGAELRETPGGYADEQAFAAALDGVDTLLLVSAAEAPERVEHHAAAVRALSAAGVRHVVYVSFLGASAEATFTLAHDHHHTEELLRRSGARWTFLRDSLYLDFLPGMVGADGVLSGPAGSGRVAAVARHDVAAAATAVLRAPGDHEGATYELTGPEAFTLKEAAATMAAASGKPISFHNEALQEAFERRMDPDVPDFMINAWVTTYLAIKRGELDRQTGDVERLTGRPPTGFAALLAQLPGCLDHVTAT